MRQLIKFLRGRRLFFRLDHRLGDFFKLHAVAEPAQKAREFFPRAAHQRHHVGGDAEAAFIAPLGNDRANEVGQALEHVEAHGARAADAEAQRFIETLRRALLGGRGGEAGRRRIGQIGKRIGRFRLALQGPERQQKPGGRGFQKRGHEDGIRAEAHTIFAQLAAGGLVGLFQLVCHGLAAQMAEIFIKLEGDAAGKACNVFGGVQFDERFEDVGDMAAQPFFKPRLNLFPWR